MPECATAPTIGFRTPGALLGALSCAMEDLDRCNAYMEKKNEMSLWFIAASGRWAEVGGMDGFSRLSVNSPIGAPRIRSLETTRGAGR